MEPARVAELQVVLEGVPLPAELSTLGRYALQHGATGEQLAVLQRLPTAPTTTSTRWPRSS